MYNKDISWLSENLVHDCLFAIHYRTVYVRSKL